MIASLRRLVRRSAHLLRRRTLEREMDEEMRSHLAFEVEDRVRRGMTPDEARRTALAAFGGVESAKDAGRDARGLRWFDDLRRDLRYAERALSRTPAFTIAAALTVALGVGATAVVVSGVRALLTRPLPVANPERLVIYSERWERGTGGFTSMAYPVYTYEHFLDVQDASRDVFDGLAAFAYHPFSLRIGDAAEMLSGQVTSANYFDVLGVRPALGRFYFAATDRSSPVLPEIVISHALWQRRFGGDSTLLGRTLHVNSRPVTVVGVAPERFHGPIAGLLVDAWMAASTHLMPPPIPRDDARRDDAAASPRRPLRLTYVGRLAPNVTRAQAEALLGPVVQAMPPEQDWARVEGVRLSPLEPIPAMARGGVQAFMGILSAVAALLVLLAAANVAGMLLARATHRRREIAIRLAVGAGPWRLVRQLLVESTALSLIGAVLGLALAAALIRIVTVWLHALLMPLGTAAALDLRIDPSVLAIAIASALAAGLVAGLVPAFGAARVDVIHALRGQHDARAGQAGRLRRAFVTTQVALSLALLIAAGLLTRALQRALEIDPGLEADGVVAAGIDLGPHGYSRERVAMLHREYVTRLAARPEVLAVGMGRSTPLGGSYSGMGFEPVDATNDPDRRVHFTWAAIDTGYLATVQIPLLAGRNFTHADTRGAPRVAIVNETGARRLWPSGEPVVGRRIRPPGANIDYEIVGVVRDGRYRQLDESPLPFAFLPLAQQDASVVDVFVRTRAPLSATTALMRDELRALDPNVALLRPRLLTSDVDLWRVPQRVASRLVGAIGVAGLLLAAVGLYGVLAYHAARRAREFGVRLALGATSPAIAGLVVREGLRMLAPGTLLGFALALLLARPMARFLYGVEALDPVTFTIVPLVLAAVTLAASYLPARRAARTDPMVSLRVD